MQLVIETDGTLRCIYDEALDLTQLGAAQITRASHVEPNAMGQWLVDLSPVDGPQLGPFMRRSEALAAEVAWLTAYWLKA